MSVSNKLINLLVFLAFLATLGSAEPMEALGGQTRPNQENKHNAWFDQEIGQHIVF